MTRASLLDRLTDPGALRVRFQPIQPAAPPAPLFALEGLVQGPPDTNIQTPAVLFEYVRRKQATVSVDTLCIRAILKAATAFPAHTRLALNVHAATLAREPDWPIMLTEIASAHDIASDRLIVEVVEHSPVVDLPTFHVGLSRLRDRGVAIALDDVGDGYANLRMILDVAPDLFKVSRHFIRGVHTDPHRLALIEGIVHIASRFGARVVAEGVDDPGELDAVMRAGVDLVQGFLIARPVPADEIVARGGFDTALV